MKSTGTIATHGEPLTDAAGASDELAARREDPRYVELMKATRLAARDGYDGVSMRDLAKATRMSLATIYGFCSSKDQLIAEAHADRMERFRIRLEHEPPAGSTASARVREVVDAMVDALENDDIVTRTLMRALYSGQEGVGPSRVAVGASYRAMIDSAIGDEQIADRDAVIETFAFVLDAVILDWLMPGLTSEDHDASDARRVLDQAVALLFK